MWLYFSKEDGCLANLIDNELDEDKIKALGNQAKKRIESEYSWSNIVYKYESLFKNIDELERISDIKIEAYIND